MNHAWVVEFLHPNGWTPYCICLSRSDARAHVKLERGRYGTKWKIRASKFVRATNTSNEVPHG